MSQHPAAAVALRERLGLVQWRLDQLLAKLPPSPLKTEVRAARDVSGNRMYEGSPYGRR